MLSNDADVWPTDVIAVVGHSNVVSATAKGFAIGDEDYDTLEEALAATAIGDGDPVVVRLPETSPISVESFVDLVAAVPSEFSRRQSSLDEPALTVNGQGFHAIALEHARAPVASSDQSWVFVPEQNLNQSLGWASISEEGAMMSGTWESSVTLLPSGSVLIEERADDELGSHSLFIRSGNFSRVSAVQEWLRWIELEQAVLVRAALRGDKELADTVDAADWATDTLNVGARLELTQSEQEELWGE